MSDSTQACVTVFWQSAPGTTPIITRRTSPDGKIDLVLNMSIVVARAMSALVLLDPTVSYTAGDGTLVSFILSAADAAVYSQNLISACTSAEADAAYTAAHGGMDPALKALVGG